MSDALQFSVPVIHTNRAFQAAFSKGYATGIDGGMNKNPYPDYLCGRYQHIPTFSRAFRKYWQAGYEAGLHARNSEKETL
jgi:ribosome modulation factor